MLYGDATYGDAYGDDLLVDAETDEDEGPGGGRRSRVLVVVGSVLGALVVLALLVALWANRQINPGGSPGDEVTVELENGQSTAEIAQVLADHGVVGDARVFTVYARLRSRGDIQAGVYNLQTKMSMGDVLGVLAEGPTWDEAMSTVREGLTVEQTISHLSDPENGSRFEEAELREALETGSVTSRHLDAGELGSYEGMLYPSTYGFDDDMSEAEFLQQMVDEFDVVYEELDVEANAAGVGLESGYEALIVASMVEKEARVAEDRGKIARVIYNRLDADTMLAIDATTCYIKDELPCELTQADLESDSPYNTRTQTGLPPTPIASVGRASMEAALNPAEGDWFYYILDAEADDGSHLFTSDRDEFNAAKDRCEAAGLCG